VAGDDVVVPQARERAGAAHLDHDQGLGRIDAKYRLPLLQGVPVIGFGKLDSLAGGAASRGSCAQPARSAATAAAARAGRREPARIVNPSQLHLELHLDVGADGIGRLPLAEADAEGAALERELAFHGGAVARGVQ